MTKAKRMIRAVHAGLICWIAGSLVGVGLVSLVPVSWVLKDYTKGGLVLHHVLFIALANVVTAAAFAVVFRMVLEYQHTMDLKEKAQNEK